MSVWYFLNGIGLNTLLGILQRPQVLSLSLLEWWTGNGPYGFGDAITLCNSYLSRSKGQNYV